MVEQIPDLLAIDRGTVTAPAGCGKTHLIAEALKRYNGSKPILILTHTNAGVVALRDRLDKARVRPSSYNLSTLDGWAIRLIGMFPTRSEIDLSLLKLEDPKNNYPAIRKAAAKLLKAGHILEILSANYSRLIVDEYQDCSILQHAIVYYAAAALPVCVLGDPMQAIFGWPGNELAKWDTHVCAQFPLVGELTTPWRWKNADTEVFGRWLLDVRRALIDGRTIDLVAAPAEVSWVDLDGRNNRARQLHAAKTEAPSPGGTVLIIGKSTNPSSQHEFASQTPGAITVEAVDLKDLVQFAQSTDFFHPDALAKIISFANLVMTNVGAQDLLRRIEVLERGTARRVPSEVERAALAFKAAPSAAAIVELLVEIEKDAGVRTHRPAVLRAAIKALQSCAGSEDGSFYKAAVSSREQNRLLGRPLPNRAVGSTLLLKGLEADVAVILDAGDLDARNLYVAMTRGAKRLVVCSNTSNITRAI